MNLIPSTRRAIFFFSLAVAALKRAEEVEGQTYETLSLWYCRCLIPRTSLHLSMARQSAKGELRDNVLRAGHFYLQWISAFPKQFPKELQEAAADDSLQNQELIFGGLASLPSSKTLNREQFDSATIIQSAIVTSLFVCLGKHFKHLKVVRFTNCPQVNGTSLR